MLRSGSSHWVQCASLCVWLLLFESISAPRVLRTARLRDHLTSPVTSRPTHRRHHRSYITPQQQQMRRSSTAPDMAELKEPVIISSSSAMQPQCDPHQALLGDDDPPRSYHSTDQHLSPEDTSSHYSSRPYSPCAQSRSDASPVSRPVELVIPPSVLDQRREEERLRAWRSARWNELHFHHKDSLAEELKKKILLLIWVTVLLVSAARASTLAERQRQ